MDIVIFGSRDFNNYRLMQHICRERIATLRTTTRNPALNIISGMARGADKLAVTFAKHEGYAVIEMPADWEYYGKQAGYIRNTAMATEADHAIGFWDGESRGTAHMIGECLRRCKTLLVVNYTDRTLTLYRDGVEAVKTQH